MSSQGLPYTVPPSNKEDFNTLRARVNLRAMCWRNIFTDAWEESSKSADDVYRIGRDTANWLDGRDCPHEIYQTVVYSNGSHRSQCVRCGHMTTFIKKEPGNYPGYVDVDEILAPSRDEMREHVQALIDDLRKNKNAEWWRWYTSYLKSPEWKRRRDAVLDRDNHRCTARLDGCTGNATQVHHLSYVHAGNEPLFELVSICQNCHQQLTEADRARR